MIITKLYRYKKESGEIIISPQKPETEYTELFRISADDKKLLTNNWQDYYAIIDVENPNDWYEITSHQEEKYE